MPIYPNLPLVISKQVLHLLYHKEKKKKDVTQTPQRIRLSGPYSAFYSHIRATSLNYMQLVANLVYSGEHI